MKAMILEHCGLIEDRPLGLVEIPTPMPAADELLVRVEACGICRTDLHVIEGELPNPKLPLIPGHQIVGRVAELGSECCSFKIGDRVGIAWLRSTCGHCEFCVSGQENLCASSEYTGYHANGGFAEYAVVREAFAYRIPEVFSSVEATPLLCAGIIGFRALTRAALPRPGTLGIYGFGSSAHITIQVARARGARVFVATRGREHQELARKLGADWVGGSSDALPELVDSAIVFAPVGDLVPTALESLKPGGTLALAGIYMTPVPSLDYGRHLFHEKNLRSVEANTRIDGLALLKAAAEIPIRPEVISFPLASANEALVRLKSDGLRGTGVLLP